MFGATSKEKAYIAPFVAFMAFLAINEIVGKIFDGMAGSWWVSEPRFWVYPLQTVVCGWLLARGWKHYEFGPLRGVVWWLGVGVLVFAIWIAPQTMFGAEPRLDGFDPTYFGHSGGAYWTTVALRFVRLVVVVPLLEEIFWRGFLLRYLIREPFHTVPFGTFSWLSFGVVTAGFMLEHQPADYAAAAVAGMLYNLVAYRARNLLACVLAHAITNLLLGLFVMRTGQWGFW